jgi:uncharacterized protein (TIGR00369 family)
MSEAQYTSAIQRATGKSSDYCFACGQDNEHGMRLRIVPTEDGCRAVFTPPRRFEGFHGMVHGGIVATLLDEVIAWACRLRGYNGLTAELTVRYKKPVPVNEPVELIGRVLNEHGKLVHAESLMRNEKGEVLATARAKMIR